MQLKGKGKKFWITVSVVGVIMFSLFISASSSSAKSKQAREQVVELESGLEKEIANVERLEAEIEEKSNRIIELEKKVEEAKPWFEMTKREQEKLEAEEKKKQEAEKAAAKKKKEEERAAAKKKAEEEEKARKAAEEEEKRKQEEEEKKGYDTGITYDELARTPDEYEGEKVKFQGKVIQVMEDDYSVQLRIAVNNDYDKIIYVEYDSDIVDSRVLEDDQITVMGLSMGLLTYESTMGGNITIPAILVAKIEQ